MPFKIFNCEIFLITGQQKEIPVSGIRCSALNRFFPIFATDKNEKKIINSLNFKIFTLYASATSREQKLS